MREGKKGERTREQKGGWERKRWAFRRRKRARKGNRR